MAALDTNILARYLVRDDTAQFAKAQRLITAALARGEALYAPITVLLELEWVLRSRYELAKAEIALSFGQLLSCAELAFGDEGAVEHALHLFQQSSADFADCVHVALAFAAQQSPLHTFDKRAAALPGAALA